MSQPQSISFAKFQAVLFNRVEVKKVTEILGNSFQVEEDPKAMPAKCNVILDWLLLL